ncbi:phospholipase A1 VesT1.02-like [Eurosta solidaginis]|uniref:phospholipase A1 VesT1.02-like n=1 Tax=Eurosta solidaginis TaxID=178769 RepID=UPI003530B611
MKVVLRLLIVVATAMAMPAVPERISGEGGWYVPQLDGTMAWVTSAEAEQMSKQVMGRAATTVHFHLYTNENPTTPNMIINGDDASLTASNFNKNNPTRIVIHGWQSDGDSDMMNLIRNAYLSRGDYNVFCVDWSDKALSLNYAASKLRVTGVGKQVANLIDFLYKDGGMSYDTLHLIGHSLGAHIAGHAGKNVLHGQINQIVGLDPALPLFSYETPSERLNQNDAYYVETIHTSGGLLGFAQPIGKSAFYPNGGRSQPGCGIDIAGSCAHKRAYIYFAEAIANNNYPSMKCSNWEKAIQKSCGKTYSTVRMASARNFVSANGDFYVPVNKKAPFGKGL